MFFGHGLVLWYFLGIFTASIQINQFLPYFPVNICAIYILAVDLKSTLG